MKKRPFFSIFGILLFGMGIAGLSIEFLAMPASDINNCFLSSHDGGTEYLSSHF
ncbi:MAG: hypothetical protein J7647_13740 [Cyanobacteria bacterium SBLK]|nr:hypothetical protein [Cyanobacteria bacterium SBLK]